MEGRLNHIQLEILKLFSTDFSKEELIEIKELLQTYLAHKVVVEADKSFEKKNTQMKYLISGKKNILGRKAYESCA